MAVVTPLEEPFICKKNAIKWKHIIAQFVLSRRQVEINFFAKIRSDRPIRPYTDDRFLNIVARRDGIFDIEIIKSVYLDVLDCLRTGFFENDV